MPTYAHDHILLYEEKRVVWYLVELYVLAEIGTDMYVRHLQAHVFSGVYILENIPPPPPGRK